MGGITTGGGVAVLAGIIYLLRLLWRKNKRTSVRDKVVLITGASSGLGEACAHVFYRAGAKVILAARRVPELERVARELKTSKDVEPCQMPPTGFSHPPCLPESVTPWVRCTTMGDFTFWVANPHDPKIICLDLEDLGTIPRVAKVALAFYGHVDILINNGGISYRGQATRTSMAVDVKVMTINYFGQVALTKAILPSMTARQQGHIVGISSIQGKFAIPYRSPYSASKHAFQAFLDTLRAEVARSNIQVTAISPGYIRTNLSLNAVTGHGSAYGVVDANTSSGMSAGAVAGQVLDAVVHGDQEVVLAPLLHRAAILLRAVCPALFFTIMLSRARKQRREMEKTK